MRLHLSLGTGDPTELGHERHQGFFGGLKRIIGGNIEAYTEACEQARKESYLRMLEHATDKGADAVIAMRYDATEFGQGATEVLAYGTAVRLERV